MEYLMGSLYHPEFNQYPAVIQYQETIPVISSQECEFDLPMYMTKETLVDSETFRDFVGNAVSRFRKTKYYKAYKSYLMSIGINRSQTLGNITEDMAPLEMHHNFLTIYDISIMVTEHVVNTVGMISSFDLIQLLILAHQSNSVPIVFLDETSHQMFHSDIDSFLPPNQCFGRWWQLLYDYRYGITLDIARKVLLYIDRYYKNDDPMVVQVRNDILSFASQNEYGGYTNGDTVYNV